MTAVSNNDVFLAAITSSLQQSLRIGGKHNPSQIVLEYYFNVPAILEAFKSLQSMVGMIGSVVTDDDALFWKLWGKELNACTILGEKIAQIRNAELRFASLVQPRNRIETDALIIPAVRLRPEGREDAAVSPVCLVSNQKNPLTFPMEGTSNPTIQVYNNSFHPWKQRFFEPLAPTTAQIRFYLLYNQAIFDITIRE